MDFSVADPWRDLVLGLTLAALGVAGFCSRECYHSRAIVRLLPTTRAERGGADDRLRQQRFRLAELGCLVVYLCWQHGTAAATLAPVVILILLNSLLTLRAARRWQAYFSQYPQSDPAETPQAGGNA